MGFTNILTKTVLILISVWIVFGDRPNSPREYTEEYPETRRLPPTPSAPLEIKSKNKHLAKNITLVSKRARNATQNGTIAFKTRRLTVPSEFAHPKCAECLDDKYLKHYYAKGCKPIEGEIICNKPCPKYFDCPKKQIKTSHTGCDYKGRFYEINQEVPVDDPCRQACICVNSNDLVNNSKPAIVCAEVECFGDLSIAPNNCYNFYEFGKCCSTRRECPTPEELEDLDKCSYDGKVYKSGQRIYPKEDPCLECICNKDWNQNSPLNSTACRKLNCEFELNAMSKEGCIPIYHKETCCPINYHCPTPKQWKCLFDGQHYRIGEKLDIGDNQIECKCQMPPDFTCIQKPSSPLLRPAIYPSLPLQPLTRPAVASQPIRSSEPIRPSELTRPAIEKNNSHLLRPAKHDRTKPSNCPPFIPGGLSCAGFNCTTIFDKNGCQACSCERPCPSLDDCKDPCYLFAVTPGQCPQCQC